MAACTMRPDALTLSHGRGHPAETFRHTPFYLSHLHLNNLSLLLCYNINCGAEMSTSFFSLSALTRFLLALVLIVFIGLAVRWAVALP
jgi:hypothetical protein